MRRIIGFIEGMLLFFLTATSCERDYYNDDVAGGGTISVGLTIQTRSVGYHEGYVVGSEWENYIDISHGDYRIYFFTNDKNDETATDESQKNRLIVEFTPNDIFSTDDGIYTTYRASGEIDASIAKYSEFKVVMLANWGEGNYPSADQITIDDVCDKGLFDAFVDNDGFASVPSEDLLIPFYGVREYAGVNWTMNRRTDLEGEISLLRAVAKVEVILNEESEIDGFDSIVLHRYNAQGYCAPKNVYLRKDYDHDYTWDSDFVGSLHLVGGKNDSDQTRRAITFQQGETLEGRKMWYAYVPEYDNTSFPTDFAYIQANLSGEEDNTATRVYFANYDDGAATGTADYDIRRNYLYRFTVTVEGNGYFKVEVSGWEDCFENEFEFGE